VITVDGIFRVITGHRMTEKGNRVLIGVSGGADSVCLLFLMSELRERLGISIEALHVHHGIRGQSADEDCSFTEEQCRSLAIPCRTVYADIPETARREGLSEEEAGRLTRYRVFKESGADRIAVAHHMEDSAETTLFNLFRGTGIQGLCGIRPVSGNIIRPLIFCTRQEIEEYCREKGLSWREDETNADVELSRNRIRHNIIPEAELINPAAVKHIYDASEKLGGIWEYVEGEAEKLLKEVSDPSGLPDRLGINIPGLEKAAPVLVSLALKKAMALAAGKEKDITTAHVSSLEDLAKGLSGKKLSLPYGLTAVRSFDTLTIRKTEDAAGSGVEKEEIPFIIKEDGSESIIALPDGRKLKCSISAEKENFPVSGYTKWLDYDKIKNTAVWRTRRKGDRITIQGGSKKLKDLFIDERIPAEKRDGIFLFARGSDVIWVPGLRIGYGYRITEETKRVLRITLEQQDDNDG